MIDGELTFALAGLIGFFAQLVDGSMGMGYKTSSTALLLSTGITPLIASSSVHSAGVLVSAISGFTHWKLGNVRRDLFQRLIIPGVIGGVIGAALLSVIPTAIIKPLVAIYLVLMGLRILWKAFGNHIQTGNPKVRIRFLGLAGGFFDAIGGGGWGPIVTSTLVMKGFEPRYVIGSVNAAEVVVSAAQAITFLALLGSLDWHVVGGLLLGGAIAAPFAAYATQWIPARKFMFAVGFLVIILSLRTLLVALGL